jgi:FXSXX-COOH protein
VAGKIASQGEAVPRNDVEPEAGPDLVDLTTVRVAHLLHITDDGALARALRRARREATAPADQPITAFQSAAFDSI